MTQKTGIALLCNVATLIVGSASCINALAGDARIGGKAHADWK